MFKSSKKITSFPRIKDFGISRGDSENGSSSCYSILKTSWDVLEGSHKRNLTSDCDFDKKTSEFSTGSCANDQNLEIKNENQMISELDKGLDHRVAGVNLRDSKAESEKEKNNGKDQDHDKNQESSLDTEVHKKKEELLIKNVDQTPSQNAGDVQAMTEVASVEIAQIANGKTCEAGVSIGTDTSGLDVTDKNRNEKLITSYESRGEDSSTSSANFDKAYDHQSRMRVANEEYLTPDTPTSLESLHILHKKLLMLEQKESGIEESLDGNVESEPEGGDGVITVERLKSALRAEQKALETLYSQLEEDQAMAIINHDAKEEERFSSHEKTPVDEVVNMEDSLEEERSSILLQLKFLEEKLASLKEEERHFEDVTMVENVREQNEIRVDGNTCSSAESNEHLLQEILHHLHDLREMELQVQEN